MDIQYVKIGQINDAAIKNKYEKNLGYYYLRVYGADLFIYLRSQEKYQFL